MVQQGDLRAGFNLLKNVDVPELGVDVAAIRLKALFLDPYVFEGDSVGVPFAEGGVVLSSVVVASWHPGHGLLFRDPICYVSKRGIIWTRYERLLL